MYVHTHDTGLSYMSTVLSHLPLSVLVHLQWFWESIQIDACADEMLYLAKVSPRACPFHNALKMLLFYIARACVRVCVCVCVCACVSHCVCVCHITSLTCKHLLLCLCLWKDAPSKKKRKRLSTALNSSTDRFSDASLFSIASSTCSLNSESLKDAPASPLLIPTELLSSSTTVVPLPPPSSTAPTKTEGHPTSSAACSSPSPVDTARHHITSELLQTEKNFVSILRIIVEVSRHRRLKLFALAYAWLMIRHCSPFLLECMHHLSLPLPPPPHTGL